MQDNVFAEHLWRTFEYDEVYLKSHRPQGETYTNMEASFLF